MVNSPFKDKSPPMEASLFIDTLSVTANVLFNVATPSMVNSPFKDKSPAMKASLFMDTSPSTLTTPFTDISVVIITS